MNNDLAKWVDSIIDDYGGWGLFAIVVAVIASGLILFFLGYTIGAAILLVCAVLVAIAKGLVRLFGGCFIVAVLLKGLAGPIKQLSGVWLDGPVHEKFFAFVNATDYLTLIGVLFLAAYLMCLAVGVITTVLGSIRLSQNTTITPTE